MSFLFLIFIFPLLVKGSLQASTPTPRIHLRIKASRCRHGHQDCTPQVQLSQSGMLPPYNLFELGCFRLSGQGLGMLGLTISNDLNHRGKPLERTDVWKMIKASRLLSLYLSLLFFGQKIFEKE